MKKKINKKDTLSIHLSNAGTASWDKLSEEERKERIDRIQRAIKLKRIQLAEQIKQLTSE